MSEQECGLHQETSLNNVAQEGNVPSAQHEALPIAPENVLEHIKSIDEELKKIDYSNSELFGQIGANIKDITSGFQSFSAFQDEQSSRMRRFEEGYDFQIFKNFTKQIVREIFSLENLLAKTVEEDKKTLIQNSIDALVELLDRNSVSQIIPETGTLYAGQEKTMECAPVKIFTEDVSLNGRIAAIVHTGFLYEFNDGSSRVIAPAKVLLFSNNKEQCSEASVCTPGLTDKAKGDLQKLTTVLGISIPTTVNPKKLLIALIIVLLLVSSTVLGLVVHHQSLIIQELLSRQQDNSSQKGQQLNTLKSDTPPTKVTNPVQKAARRTQKDAIPPVAARKNK